MTINCLVLVALAVIGSVQVFFLSKHYHSKREDSALDPIVDVGYSVYRGHYEKALQLNYFKGIRYAAPPEGALRWQKPQEPMPNRGSTIFAVNYGPKCPQSPQGHNPDSWLFFPTDQVSEDCLFLNVISPTNATALPVLVWIHGGGYGLGDGRYNFTELTMTNSRSFVIVTIQYRLGAFGFLSSSELGRFGVPNAGLYDQHFALEWVQKHITKFGGDPTRVTIAGESAGAGSVMQQIMAYGGKEGTTYFTNAIVASPYLPPQWNYDDEQPTNAYNAFVKHAGCDTKLDNTTVFGCLRAKSTYSLQNASGFVSTSASYGQWAFLPVVDGSFIQRSPVKQLISGDLNGSKMLSGHNSDEAPAFVPQSIKTKSDFESYVQSLFPNDNQIISKISELYDIPITVPGPLFSTLGSSGPTALNQSSFAIGQQQRANNLYAESTFICPSYWLANSFSFGDKRSWKYQFSVPPAAHGTDLNAYHKPDSAIFSEGTLSTGFRIGFQLILGQFTLHGDPTLPESVLGSFNSEEGRNSSEDLSAAYNSSWLAWDQKSMSMMNFNTSGGVEKQLSMWFGLGKSINITMKIEPGVMANWTISNGATWEGGRAKRCKFWADFALRQFSVR
ncbi:putative secreted lipase [Golovinomyces cichoracearum]|uniref:Carboxylic ester hydrolase n=1 Tax=Golovinomyces cichoracearum TaxID=62708 RepID=A0A420IZ25_9PEZI|nr:putative secreted lipase [Golovinomyces cichoracearum]